VSESGAARRDLVWAWAAATLFSGIPSTAWSLLTGGDPLEAARAAGAMLMPSETDTTRLLLAAAVVHSLVSLFWAAVVVLLLPRRRVVLWASLAALAIGVLDLRVLAPAFFPAVAALDYWPQMADHLAWGLLLGAMLQYRPYARLSRR
jgi:hypothetical protein